jgi:hypothetical protein
MHHNQSLEDDSPCRIAEPKLEGSEDLGNTGFTALGRGEDGFDILGLGGGELFVTLD